jgi:hypothetical protein
VAAADVPADARRARGVRRQLTARHRASERSRPAAFLGSCILSRFAFLALKVVFLLIFLAIIGDLPFDVAVQASLLAHVVVVAGVACFTGLAVLCAARTASIEVVSGLVNASR